MDIFRQEFALKNFLLTHDRPENFVRSQWPLPPAVFVAYRVLVVAFYFTWLVISGPNTPGFFTFLTDWSFLLLNASQIWRLATAIWGYVIFRRREEDPSALSTMPWFLKVDWLLYNVATAINLCVSIAFWTLLYAELGLDLNGIIGALVLIMHGFNSIYVIIDLFVGATPIRLLHFYQSVIVGLIYVCFSAIYTTQTGEAIYPILDWNGDPGSAALYALLLGLVGLPVLWVVVFGLYRLRIVIYTRCCGLQQADSDTHDELYSDQDA